MTSAASLLLVLGLVLGLALHASPAAASRISLNRRDSDLDSLASEFRFKGGRMRFGKRSFMRPDETGNLATDAFMYTPDRYAWLQ